MKQSTIKFKKNKYEKVCKKCNKIFKMQSGVQKWCYDCTTYNCKNCLKEYRKAGTNMSQYCSKKCFDVYRVGKKMVNKPYMTKEQRKRAAKTLRRVHKSPDGVALKERISIATKKAMQRPEVQLKIRQPKGALSLERRIQISNNLAGKMPKNLMYPGTKYGNVKRGYYDINGDTMYFRSKWEANYALYLDFLIDCKEIYKWEFEPDTFMFEAIKLGTRSYTPDFKVYTDELTFEYHEVKGYMDSKSKTKLKRFAKYYPEHKLVLVDAPIYNEIKKKLGTICKFY